MLSFLWKRLSENGPGISGRALRRFPQSEVDRLLRARVLVEQQKVDTWSVCTHCECGLDARPVREVGENLVACCPYDAGEDVVLAVEDLLRFTIEPDRLASAISASGSLAGGISKVEDGIWLLGSAPSGRVVMLCLDPQLLSGLGTTLAMRSVAAGSPVTVLAAAFDPAEGLRVRAMGFDGRNLADVMVPDEDAFDRLAVDRLAPTAHAARLVLDLAVDTAAFDGRRLDLSPQMFAAFRMLVERLGQRDPVLRNRDIEQRFDRDARGVVRDLRKALAQSLSTEDTETLVQTVRNRGYRLGLDQAEVTVSR